MPVSFNEYRRPPAAAQPEGDLVFQLVDIDYSLEKPVDGFTPVEKGRSPVLRLFGVDANGSSVTCIAHGFYPYFYIAPSRRLSQEECDLVHESLEDAIKGAITNQGWSPQYVLSVEPQEKMNIYGFRTTTSQYLKITLQTPKHIPVARKIIEQSQLDVLHLPDVRFARTTFESALVFVTRFMTDTKVDCGGWIRIKKGHYSSSRVNSTTSVTEVDVMYKDIIPEKEDKIAPQRFMYFDIECDATPGHFPNAIRDPVITISCHLVEYGRKGSDKKIRFQLKDCEATQGVHILQFESEREMLMAFRDFMLAYDPDLMLGWNILTFDFPYLLDRAAALFLKDFKKFSRVKEYDVTARDDHFESKAYGKRNSKKITCNGRVPFDMMVYVMREKKLRAYGLNAVSRDILGESKKDLHYKLIHVYFHQDAKKRKEIGDYCDWDAVLPKMIGDKLAAFTNTIGMITVTHVTMNMLLTQGQQVRVMAQIHRIANPDGYVIPTTPDDDKAAPSDEKSYEGAVVIEPKRGYYDEYTPVATLDFASLYPSIMMAHNLCYSTMLLKDEWGRYNDPSMYHTTPHEGCRFVNTEVKKGVLPRILELLVGERKAVRNEQKTETDPLRWAVLEGRQLALKVSANSVYGFTGAMVGRLPCIEISASVTAYGREMIMATKRYIEEHYTIANGYEGDAEVIYGDTDSVMVIFKRYRPTKEICDGTDDDKAKWRDAMTRKVMGYGIEACGLITATFIRPVKLEFEKVYCPYLLINKKRYAGNKLTLNEETNKIEQKMDVKGLETVRRDSCPMVRTFMDKILKILIVERNVEKARQCCIDQFGALMRGEIDVSQLVITKALSKGEEEYKSKQVHIEMMNRIKLRDPAFNPSIGDRLPYVMIKNTLKGTKKFEQSEEPIYAIEHNLPIDYKYYLEFQLRKPMTRIFQYIIPDVEYLFSGPHTRYSYQIAEGDDPTKNTITKYFTTKVDQCLSCRTSMPGLSSGKKRPLCDNCSDDENASKVYQLELKKLRKAEQQHHTAWSTCRTCQVDNGGKLVDPDSCGNMECIVFYARTKAIFDVSTAKKRVNKFLDW